MAALRKLLEEKHNAYLDKAEALLDKAKFEKRELTEDEAAELAEIRDNVRKILETLQLDDDFRQLNKLVDAKGEAKKADSEKDEDQKMKEAAEVRAFEDYIRGSVYSERAAGDNLTLAANGALIPQVVLNKIIKQVYNICPILERSSKYNVKGNLSIPYYSEDANNLVNVAYQDEFVELASNVGSFSSIDLTGYLAGALTKVSRSLINRQEFDLTGFVVEHMSYAIKRFIEKEMLNGTSNKVEGLSGVTRSITAGAATAITGDEIINLHDKIIDEYQGNAIWIMHPETRTALRTLKDSNERYLLQDDISLPFGSSLLGKPVYVSDNMPVMASGKTAIYYGDMSGLATKWVEEMNIQVLRELYAAQHAIGVVGWLDFDSKVENAQKIAKLVMA